MFVSKKEFEKLERRVEQQEEIIKSLSYQLMQLHHEVQQLKKNNETAYLG